MINKITAADARKITEDHLKMVKIFDTIRHMSSLGFYYVYADLTRQEVVDFRDLGYTVGPVSNPKNYQISWEAEDV